MRREAHPGHLLAEVVVAYVHTYTRGKDLSLCNEISFDLTRFPLEIHLADAWVTRSSAGNDFDHDHEGNTTMVTLLVY